MRKKGQIMLNQVVIVGIVESVLEDANYTGALVITLRVEREHKEPDGTYKVDRVNVLCKPHIASKVLEEVKVGQLLGMKGRLEQDKTNYNLNVICEKYSCID